MQSVCQLICNLLEIQMFSYEVADIFVGTKFPGCRKADLYWSVQVKCALYTNTSSYITVVFKGKQVAWNKQ